MDGVTSLTSLGVRTHELEITQQSLSHHRHPEITETGVTVRISGDAGSDHEFNSSRHRSEHIMYLYRVGVTEDLCAPQAVGRFMPAENRTTDLVRHERHKAIDSVGDVPYPWGGSRTVPIDERYGLATAKDSVPRPKIIVADDLAVARSTIQIRPLSARRCLEPYRGIVEFAGQAPKLRQRTIAANVIRQWLSFQSHRDVARDECEYLTALIVQPETSRRTSKTNRFKVAKQRVYGCRSRCRDATNRISYTNDWAVGSPAKFYLRFRHRALRDIPQLTSSSRRILTGPKRAFLWRTTGGLLPAIRTSWRREWDSNP